MKKAYLTGVFAVIGLLVILSTTVAYPVLACDGEGGIRNIKKATGNANCPNAFGLKRMRNKPARNMGKANMWYSSGVKVYEPCQYNSIAVIESSVPAIVDKCLVSTH